MITYLEDCIACLDVELEHSREQIAQALIETFGKAPDAFADVFYETINVVTLERVRSSGDVESETVIELLFETLKVSDLILQRNSSTPNVNFTS